MKKSLLFIVIILSCLRVNAQEGNDTLVSIAKLDYVGLTQIPYEESYHSDHSSFFWELVPEGLAVTNLWRSDEAWSNWLIILCDLSLEEGHDYVVRLTMKIPSEGAYWLDLGSWSIPFGSGCRVPVKPGYNSQIIDVDYPEYGANIASDGYVILCFGGVVGTTIIQEVEVLEKTTTARMKSAKPAKGSGDTLYNLSGQKVNTSYKGIVIQNGKKVVK